MKEFGTWLARLYLRRESSSIWTVTCVLWALSYEQNGLWVFLWMALSAIPITAIEIWWNDYADDYSDLEEE